MRVTFNANDVILAQGDVSDFAYLIVDGDVEVTRQGRRLAALRTVSALPRPVDHVHHPSRVVYQAHGTGEPPACMVNVINGVFPG